MAENTLISLLNDLYKGENIPLISVATDLNIIVNRSSCIEQLLLCCFCNDVHYPLVISKGFPLGRFLLIQFIMR